MGWAVNGVALARLRGRGQRFALNGGPLFARVATAGADDFKFAGNGGDFARFVDFSHVNQPLAMTGFKCPTRALIDC